MNRNRKVVQGAILAGAIAVMTTVTSTNTIAGQTEQSAPAQTVFSVEVTKSENMTAGISKELAAVTLSSLESASVDLRKNKTSRIAEGETEEEHAYTAGVLSELLGEDSEEAEPAIEGSLGITSSLSGSLAEALAGTEGAAAEDDTENTALISEEGAEADPAEEPLAQEAEENPAEEIVLSETAAAAYPEWSNKLMANVEDSLNIRSAADEESEVIGKLYAGAVADVVEAGEDWTHISSGSVDGYVKNEYCVTGDAAYALAEQICSQTAVTLTGGLRFRSEASEDAGIISTLEEGTHLTVSQNTEAPEGWTAVSYKGESGFVSAEYVDISMDYATALSIEEEQKKLAAEQAEKAKTEQVASTGTATQTAGAAASVDDVTLLAALIQCEAGTQPYEGQVAVGNVVVNRLHSGAYGGSISSVIYAPGQFSPAGSGAVARVLASGVKANCVAAAQAALAGENYIGGCTQFRNVACGHPGTVIGSHVFW